MTCQVCGLDREPCGESTPDRCLFYVDTEAEAFWEREMALRKRDERHAAAFVQRIKKRLGYIPSGLQVLAASRAELEGTELFERILDALHEAEQLHRNHGDE